MTEVEKLQYPIGKFLAKENYSQEEINELIQNINDFPEKLEATIRNLSAIQHDTPYREGGWTVRQLLHHISDSHLNAYIRTKWTLTENTPVIKAYNEKLWAITPEINSDPLISIDLLKILHRKWVILLRSLTSADLQKTFIHPETKKEISLQRLIALYEWHGKHHLAHITSLVNRMKWR